MIMLHRFLYYKYVETKILNKNNNTNNYLYDNIFLNYINNILFNNIIINNILLKFKDK